MQPQAAKLAGRIGDALVSVTPEKDIVVKFDSEGGEGKPKYGHITACWATSKDEAKKTAFEAWPNALVEGSASQELPLPKDFEQLVEDRDPDDLDGAIPLGPDAQDYIDEVKKYEQADFTHVYFHQVGPDQEGFLQFAKAELLPHF